MKIEWDFSELYKFADNLVNNSLDKPFERVAKEIAKVLLEDIKGFTPIDETHTLINGWNGNSFAVKKFKYGYRVDIVNTAPYAKWVNDGHKAHNQLGGPYKIHQDRRKLQNPHAQYQEKSEWFVYGHFFVERGIEKLENTTEIEKIIMRELQKWWEGCFNG